MIHTAILILAIAFQENPLANIKKIDCALLPPSLRTLEKKLQRAHYVTVLWSHANTASPDQGLSPTDYGWSVKSDLLQPTWFDGLPAPDSLFSSHADGGDVNIDNGDDSDSDETIILSRSEENDMETDDLDELSDHAMSNMSDDEPWSEESDSDVEEME